MLVELWAYTGELLSIYDQAIANESYVRTAVLRPSLRTLIDLLGYRPRPATAAVVELGAIVDGNRPVTFPAGTAFRSSAFGADRRRSSSSSRRHRSIPRSIAGRSTRRSRARSRHVLGAARRSGDVDARRWRNRPRRDRRGRVRTTGRQDRARHRRCGAARDCSPSRPRGRSRCRFHRALPRSPVSRAPAGCSQVAVGGRRRSRIVRRDLVALQLRVE